MLRSNMFFYCAMAISNLYFQNKIKFDLKSIDQEFILFIKVATNITSNTIQYFTIEL